MKIFLFIVLLAPTFSFADADLAAITRAISAGDADALGRFFDQTVEVAVMDEEDIYNKEQAIALLKTFFAKNPPKSFSQVHQGTSRGNDSQYCIGNLLTAASTFRVYIYMKVVDGRYIIQELRFDKE